MPLTLTVVTAQGVEPTGVFDYSFMFAVRLETFDAFWGWLRLVDADGLVRPLADLLPARESANPLRWSFDLFTSGGRVMESSAGAHRGGLLRIFETIARAGKDATILMDQELLPEVELAARAVGVELVVHRYDGPLATSRKRAL